MQIPEYESLQDRFSRYDAQVVGISTDQRFSNKAWADSLGGISFPLLADFYPQGEVARRYGVYVSDGPHAGQCERAVFVVDKQGVIRYIDVHDVNEEPDPEDIFAVLQQIEGKQ